MRVYSNSGKTFTSLYSRVAGIVSWKGYFWLGFAVASVIGVLMFYGSKEINVTTLSEQIKSLKAYDKRMYYSLTTFPEKISIDIPFENMQTIEAKRQEALAAGVLIADDSDLVSANIRYQGDTIPVKLRLKGDWTDHLNTDKWSFRIHTKGDKKFMGMTSFSIQAPETRNNLNDWLFLQVLKEHGVISTRYDFIDVTINGEHKGIFALEETFTKEMLEYNHRREAPILKFNEDKLWRDTVDNPQSNIQGDPKYFRESPVEAFEWNKTKNNETLFSEFLRAQQKLVDWREGKLASEKVFDYDTWATYLALSNIFGSTHGVVWHNLRFYYNPITDLLEPVPYDNLAGEEIKAINYRFIIELLNEQLFSDPHFLDIYFKKLDEFSKGSPNLISDHIQSDLDKYSRLLNREKSYDFNPDFITNNQKFVVSRLRSTNPLVAYLDTTNNLKITFNSEVKIDINAIEYLDKKMVVHSPQPKVGENSITIPLNFIPDIRSLDQMRVHYSTPFDEGYVPVREWPQVTVAQIGTPLIYHPQVRRHGAEVVLQGNISIDKIYRVSDLTIAPGSQIDFTHGGGLIITHQLTISGEENNKVHISSSDKTGQGILVTGNGTSTMKYTTVDGLKNFNVDLWATTGALTFYHTTVNIDHVELRGIQAEDSINIVLSTVNIQNLVVSDSFSDSVDFDFTNGQVANLTCNASGNDCLDLSGSTVEVVDLKANNTGDKGISVGEASTVHLIRARFNHDKIGIGAKDNSYVEGDVADIQDTRIPIAVYQKKPEYGPANVKLEGITGDTSQKDWAIEEGSSVYLLDKRYWGDKKNVYDWLETLQ